MRMWLGRWLLFWAGCLVLWGCEAGDEAGTAAVRLLRGGAGDAFGFKVTEPSPGERLPSREVTVRGWAGEGISAVMVERQEALLLRGAWQASLVLEPGQKEVTVAAFGQGRVVATARIAVEPPSVAPRVASLRAEVVPARVESGGRVTVRCDAVGDDGLPMRSDDTFARISRGPVTALDAKHYRADGAGRASFVCMNHDATIASAEALLEVAPGPVIRSLATVEGQAGEVVVEAGETVRVACRSFDAGGAERADAEAVPQFDWMGAGLAWESGNHVEMTRAGRYRLRCLSPGALQAEATTVVVTPEGRSMRPEVAIQPASQLVGGDRVRIAIMGRDRFGNAARAAGRPEVLFTPASATEPVVLAPEAMPDGGLVVSIPREGGRLDVGSGTLQSAPDGGPPALPESSLVRPASSVPLRGQCGPALLVTESERLVAYRIALLGFDPATDEVEVEGNGHEALGVEPDARGARMEVTQTASGTFLDLWQPAVTGRNFAGFRLYRNLWDGRWHRRELLFEDFCTYLTAPRILPFGEPLAHAVEGRVNQSGLDDGGASATAVASVVNAAVTASNFTAALESALQADPVLLEGVTADDYYNELDDCVASWNPLDWVLCTADVLGETLEAVSNAVGVSRIWDACVEAHPGARATDPQLSLWISSAPDEAALEARIGIDRIEVPLNRCVYDDPHGWLRLRNLSLHGTFGVAVEDGMATVHLRDLEVESLDVDGYLSFAGIDFELPDSVVTRTREQVRQTIALQLARYLSMALTQRPLASLDIGFAMPSLSALLTGSEATESARAGFQFRLTDLRIQPNGYLQAGVESRMSSVSGGRTGIVDTSALPSYLLPGTGEAVVPPTSHEPLGVSLQQGWLNGFGYAAWEAGSLDGYLPLRAFSSSAQEAFGALLARAIPDGGTPLTALSRYALDEGGLGLTLSSELPISLEGFDPETGDAWLGIGPVVMDLANCTKAGCPSVATLPAEARLAAGALGLVPPVRVAARLRVRLEVGPADGVAMRGLAIRTSELAPQDLWVALDRSLTPQAADQALAVAGMEREALTATVTALLTEEVVPALGEVGPVAFPAFRTDFAGLGDASSLAVTLDDETELLELDRLSVETGRFFVTTGLTTATAGGAP